MQVTKFSKFEETDLAYLKQVVGQENVSTEEAELVINAMDSFPGEPVKPDAVVWPDSTEQISKIVKYANDRRLPIVPRGGGSSLSGNVVPVHHGIVLSFKRMKRILEIHEKDLQVVVQPGVVPDELNERLKEFNLFFPPDPGSSSSCTIGGMVANNASGMGAVKYGVTREYVLKLELVLPNGQIIRSGSNAFKSSTGYDLIGLFVGSEGTLGVITEITLKLRTLPQTRKTAVTYFDSVSDTTDAVSEIVGSGLSPASLEFLDQETILAINKAERLGLSEKTAMLLLEFHGTEESASHELKQATEICKKHHLADIHVAKDEIERKKLWAGRKGAYPSLLRSSPNTIIGDIVVPASMITKMVARIYEIAANHNVKVACFGHSGDGNIHPNIMADRKDKENWERASKTNDEIVGYAIKLGGVASGEHGIGIEKKQFMELEHGNSLELMKSIKKMLDPNNILNPGKFFDL
ncbi:MAG TPA: FAD-linked oxidase C-terminal domain-containing protein [Terriglobales bacterium]|nr:FAD-linked oxidase C-terminal domain-containing protein [Terriglobales bacterium]